MPDIEDLMQEWPSRFEDLLNTVGLPSAEIDVDLAQYVDLICGKQLTQPSIIQLILHLCFTVTVSNGCIFPGS